MPGGRALPIQAAKAISAKLLLRPGAPFTCTSPLVNSTSSAATSSMCAPIAAIFSFTFAAERTSAVPPTARLRLP